MWEGAGVDLAQSRAQRADATLVLEGKHSEESQHTHTYQRRDKQTDAPRSVLQLPSRLSAREPRGREAGGVRVAGGVCSLRYA